MSAPPLHSFVLIALLSVRQNGTAGSTMPQRRAAAVLLTAGDGAPNVNIDVIDVDIGELDAG
jgi:hypothetical protein